MLMLVFSVLEVGTLLLDYKNLEQPERLSALETLRLLCLQAVTASTSEM